MVKTTSPRTRRAPGAERTLSIDVGGSGVKAMILDAGGQTLSMRERIKTPHPATPRAILKVIRQLAQALGPFGRVSVGFPGVVHQGVVATAPNLDRTWRGFHLADALEAQLRKPVRVANDADVQGLGAIKGRGVELVLTLGTGMGSALFVDGILVPNLELAHHPFRKGKSYEDQLGNAALKRIGKKQWNKRLGKAIKTLEGLFNYDALYLGGGNGKKVRLALPENVTVISNVVGLLGGIALWRELSRTVYR